MKKCGGLCYLTCDPKHDPFHPWSSLSPLAIVLGMYVPQQTLENPHFENKKAFKMFILMSTCPFKLTRLEKQ